MRLGISKHYFRPECRLKGIDPPSRNGKVLLSVMKRLWCTFSLARDQFSFPSLKFLDKRIPNSLLWKLNSCDSPNCSLHLDAKKIPDSWNIERRHFPSCQVCRWGSFALGNKWCLQFVWWYSIQFQRLEWEEVVFLGKSCSFFKSLWEISFLLMRWKTVHMALGSWVILKLEKALLLK